MLSEVGPLSAESCLNKIVVVDRQIGGISYI